MTKERAAALRATALKLANTLDNLVSSSGHGMSEDESLAVEIGAWVLRLSRPDQLADAIFAVSKEV